MSGNLFDIFFITVCNILAVLTSNCLIYCGKYLLYKQNLPVLLQALYVLIKLAVPLSFFIMVLTKF